MDLGLERAGWKVLQQCERERHARAVLRRRWPEVPLHGDVKTLRGADLPRASLWAFGSPCKGFSLCNFDSQDGLDHKESNLAYEVTRLLRERREQDRPELLIWENVPGVYSRRHALGVAQWLAGMRELGYADGRALLLSGFDAGVPQVRRRVLTLLSRVGPVPEPSWTWKTSVPPISALLEPDAGGWLTPEEREKKFLRCRDRWLKKVSERGEAEARRVVETYREVLLEGPREIATFTTVWSRNPYGERSHALVCKDDFFVGVPGRGVRKLTPLERERLMGLPEGWTETGVYEDGQTRPLLAGPRSRLTGNGVIVGVAELVGRVAAEMLKAV